VLVLELMLALVSKPSVLANAELGTLCALGAVVGID
jgi:hypothetical protein